MWQKKESKLELAASMLRQIMPVFNKKKNLIILCDRWYVKKDLVCRVDEYENLDLISNARADSVIYGLVPESTGKRDKPTVHGRKLSIQDGFILSDEKIGDYYMAARLVLTNIFDHREIMAYVTFPAKESSTRRPFFSTVFPQQLEIFCAYQEKSPLNQTESDQMRFIPILIYTFRWNIEVSYYKPKHSGHYAVIWYVAERILKCWST